MRKLALGAFLLAAGPTAAAAQTTLAIRQVAVVDVTGGPTRAGQTVLVSGNRIVAVGPAAEVRVPAGARVVDASGKYLIPGLWDAHTHLTFVGRGVLGLSLANGVTGVRDMGARHFATAKAWRDSIAAGLLLGPRMTIASPVVERPEWLAAVRRWLQEAGASDQDLRERFGPTSPEEATRWVDSVAALGADHVKIRNWSRNAAITQAILDRARHHGLPVVGHAGPAAFLPRMASIEHSFFPILELSGAGRDSLFRGIAAGGAVVVPTLATWPNRLQPADSILALLDPARTPTFRYLPAEMLEEWRKELKVRENETPYDYPAAHRAALRDLREMRALGIPVLPATDAPSMLLVSGFSLHDELALFVSDVGMTPVEALRSATLAPARFLGMADSLGTVEPGKLADLVLLDADPLADIRNTRRVWAVVANGRWLDRPALDRLLATAEGGR
ncbi:MAG TPA: amidohydrolase family protein [Longimicrobiaceae bacterium]|nr:amidohydrolase family protein [Longimicrobiaceae bacterium]